MDTDRVYLMTCESVTEGHPDKFCDRVSDSILDDILSHDPVAHVAVETMATKNKILVAGEVTSSFHCDYEDIVRKTIFYTGYSESDIGSDLDIEIRIHEQSPDIAIGVEKDEGIIGAGDQGIMYGYAVDDHNRIGLPLPYVIATDLTYKLDEARKDEELPIRPDGKVQVTIAYDDETDEPLYIDTIVCSVQHNEDIPIENLRSLIRGWILENLSVYKVFDPCTYENIKFYINPTGKFVIGGPVGDTGLTGRKLAVDTYGGIAHHGGGAMSGKDPTKVDRSGAYAARYVAKHILGAGICKRCEVAISYAIGKAKPVHIRVDTGDKKRDSILEYIVDQLFDLTPAGIIDTLHLRSTKYLQTATHGHFTKSLLPWERLNIGKVESIRSMYETLSKE